MDRETLPQLLRQRADYLRGVITRCQSEVPVTADTFMEEDSDPCKSCLAAAVNVGLLEEAAATLAAETDRADREAAARQEAERERDEARYLLKITGLSRDCLGRFYKDATAERDRLRAELAALRGEGPTT